MAQRKSLPLVRVDLRLYEEDMRWLKATFQEGEINGLIRAVLHAYVQRLKARG